MRLSIFAHVMVNLEILLYEEPVEVFFHFSIGVSFCLDLNFCFVLFCFRNSGHMFPYSMAYLVSVLVFKRLKNVLNLCQLNLEHCL